VTTHPSHPDLHVATSLGVCWHPPTSDRWACTPRTPDPEPVQPPPYTPATACPACLAALHTGCMGTNDCLCWCNGHG
jgi:hypothetical protein